MRNELPSLKAFVCLKQAMKDNAVSFVGKSEKRQKQSYETGPFNAFLFGYVSQIASKGCTRQNLTRLLAITQA